MLSAALLVFIVSAAGVLYAYVGYPLLLALLARVRATRVARPAVAQAPSLTMLIPVYNESEIVRRKVANTRELAYPGQWNVVFVSDGSTDETVGVIESLAWPGMSVLALEQRSGKAAALNLGLAHATGDLVVFSDAGIRLAPDALMRIVAPFADPAVGCVSGEDRIDGGGGEGLYGRYELMVRRLESKVGSIIGASGSFYAQRRHLCTPFEAGLAPDFLSVLRTLAAGYRAVSAADAVGFMSAVASAGREFERKTRTLLRGITTLFAYRRLLNPFRYGFAAVQLASHKLMRWLVPVFLLTLLLSNVALIGVSPLFLATLAAQVVFYIVAIGTALDAPVISRLPLARVSLFFTLANAAALVAWIRYAQGHRQELWTPSRRQSG